MRRIDDEAKVQEVLAGLVLLPPQDRQAAIARLCASAPHIEKEVRRRTSQLRQAFGKGRTGHATRLPPRIGDYDVERRLGQGGAGTVFLCRDGAGKELAVKLLEIGSSSGHQRSRFERESRALESLTHPGIARYESSGEDTIDGRDVFYIAMEYVPGGHLGEYLASTELSVRKKIRLLLQICDAVSYAHQSGIVHRDIKPTNVVVRDDGTAKVLDFGIVRFANSSLSTITAQTDGSSILGSLPYISPEQAINPHHAAENCDIYSLGVVLFEMLTGELPINIREATFTEALAAIHNAKPSLLSKYTPEHRGDLENIVSKMLCKDIEERYQSIDEVARDLRSYLAGGRVQARKPSFARQIVKLAKQFPIQTCVALALIGLVAILGLAASYFASVSQSRFSVVVQQTQLATERLTDLERRRYNTVLSNAANDMLYDPQAVAEALGDAAQCPLELREFSWRLLNERTGLVRRTKLFARRISCVVLAEIDNRNVIIAGQHCGAVRIYDADTFEHLRCVVEDGPLIRDLDVSADQSELVVGDADGVVRLVRLDDPQSRLTEVDQHESPIKIARFLPASSEVLSVAGGGTVRLWDKTENRARHLAQLPAPVRHCGLSNDRKTTLAVYRDTSPVFCDLETGKLEYSSEAIDSPYYTTGFGQSGFLVAETRGYLELWDDGKRIRRAFKLPTTPRRLASTFDGQHTIAACWESGVFLRRGSGPAANFRALHIQDARRHQTADVQIAADATWCCIAQPFELTTWQIETLGPDKIAATSYPVLRGVKSSNASSSARLFWTNQDRALETMRLDSFRKELELVDFPGKVAAIAASPTGRYVATATTDASVQLWDAQSGDRVFTVPGNGKIVALTFSHNGSKLIAGGRSDLIEVFDVQSGEMCAQLPRSDSVTRRMAFAPNSDLLIVVGRLGDIVGVEVDTGREHWRSEIGAKVSDIKFMPDGRTFITSDQNGLVAKWDSATGEQLSMLRAKIALVTHLAISPDGQTLAIGDDSGQVDLLDPETGQVRLTLDAGGDVSAITFADHGNRLVVTNTLGQIMAWDAAK